MNLTMIDCIFDTNSQYKCIDSDGDLIHINDIIPSMYMERLEVFPG